MKIAICDDEKKLRKDLRSLIEIQMDLSGGDYTIEEFEDGRDLAAAEKKKDIQILFLDIEMPGMDGMETAKALRAAGCRMLIIFVTAYPDFVFQGYEVQAFHYILKPYQPAKIKEEVRIDLPRPRDITSSQFIEYRNYITDKIKWW